MLHSQCVSVSEVASISALDNCLILISVACEKSASSRTLQCRSFCNHTGIVKFALIVPLKEIRRLKLIELSRIDNLV